MWRALGVGVEVAWWWAAALGVWLLTLSSVDQADLFVATPLALGCGITAAVARRALRADWRYPRRTAAWALRLPIALVADTLTVLSLPWRKMFGRLSDEGELVRVPVAPGAEAAASSQRAAAVLLVSLTPGSIAVHADDDTGELLVHTMGGGRWPMIEVVRR